jgi:hypothetical protein
MSANIAAVVGGRNPISEAKVRTILSAALQTGYFVSLLTKTPDDDRITLGLLQLVNDPVEWAKWADLIFGPAA